MNYFPLAVKYIDRMFPETVNTPEDIRTGVGFKVVSSNETLLIETTKRGFRVEGETQWSESSSKRSAVKAYFDNSDFYYNL